MQATDLAKFEPKRRYATLVALVIESKATIIDEIIDLHDRIISRIFNQAKNKHQQNFIASGKSIHQALLVSKTVGKALLEANANRLDLAKALESVMPWEEFAQNVGVAENLVQPNDFDFLSKPGLINILKLLSHGKRIGLDYRCSSSIPKISVKPFTYQCD